MEGKPTIVIGSSNLKQGPPLKPKPVPLKGPILKGKPVMKPVAKPTMKLAIKPSMKPFLKTTGPNPKPTETNHQTESPATKQNPLPSPTAVNPGPAPQREEKASLRHMLNQSPDPLGPPPPPPEEDEPTQASKITPTPAASAPTQASEATPTPAASVPTQASEATPTPADSVPTQAPDTAPASADEPRKEAISNSLPSPSLKPSLSSGAISKSMPSTPNMNTHVPSTVGAVQGKKMVQDIGHSTLPSRGMSSPLKREDSLQSSGRSTSNLSSLTRSESAASLSNTRDIKITTAGSSCGKSALCVQWTHNKFNDIDEPTVEDSYTKEVDVGGVTYKVKLLDTSGSGDYNSFHSDWFSKKKSDAFILVFSLTSKDSLTILNVYYQSIVKAWGSHDFPCVLVGTQSDNTTARKVTHKQGVDLARKFNCPFIEATAKQKESVDRVFETLLELTRWGGKPLDPFIHEFLTYGQDSNWKYLPQLEDRIGPKLLTILPDHYQEYCTSLSAGLYKFPKNLDPAQKKQVASTALTKVFGVTLEQCMKVQNETLPHLDVPRVFHQLIEEFLRRKDKTEEGIFRVPAVQEDVFKLRDDIDEGKYYQIHNAKDVHTIGATLKLWLRELADPLIPQDLYDSAIEEPITEEKAAEIFVSLHPLNQRIVTRLFAFLREAATYEATTKMGMENLILVFVPSLLRSPHTDPTQLMQAANLEKEFVIKLEKTIQIPPEPKISTIPVTLYLEREEKYINWFTDFFSIGNQTENFMAKTENGPVAISVSCEEGRSSWRTLIEKKEVKKLI